MPRQARLDVPGALHHIMIRGINRSAIFRDDQDRHRFLGRLGKNVQAAQCKVHAWVLMDNHVHMLFRSGNQGISAVMRKMLSWYAQYFNRRHNRTGHLFENRYKSILCEEENYLLALVRYINLNPVRANIVTTIEQLDRYPWSSHRAIIGKATYPWADIDTVLTHFAGSKRKAINAYRRFVRAGLDEGKNPVLSGGGLLRSHGGWSQVLAMKRKGDIQESDERILGSGDFVQAILREAEDKDLRQLKIRRSGRTLEKIIAEECKKAGIKEIELSSGSRRSIVSRVRSRIAYRGRDELALSAAEMARSLGVATSSITRAIERCQARGDMQRK